MGSLDLLIGQFAKNEPCQFNSVQFSYVALYTPLGESGKSLNIFLLATLSFHEKCSVRLKMHQIYFRSGKFMLLASCCRRLDLRFLLLFDASDFHCHHILVSPAFKTTISTSNSHLLPNPRKCSRMGYTAGFVQQAYSPYLRRVQSDVTELN